MSLVGSIMPVLLRLERRRIGGSGRYPDRIPSRRGGEAERSILSGHKAGGLIAGLDAEPLARLVDVRIDRVFGDAKAAGDLLGAEMLVDEPQTLPFAGGEKLQRAIRPPLNFAHNVNYYARTPVVVQGLAPSAPAGKGSRP
jgi:hypothetical protein